MTFTGAFPCGGLERNADRVSGGQGDEHFEAELLPSATAGSFLYHDPVARERTLKTSSSVKGSINDSGTVTTAIAGRFFNEDRRKAASLKKADAILLLAEVGSSLRQDFGLAIRHQRDDLGGGLGLFQPGDEALVAEHPAQTRQDVQVVVVVL